MADILDIGSSGVRAYQRSLQTVSNNIANVDTEGYTRQSHEISQSINTSMGKVNLGTGVNSEQVRRLFDTFAIGAMRNNASLLEQHSTLHDYVSKLENVVADSGISITSSIDRFFEAVQALSVTPSSASARESLLSEGRSVTERFQSLTRLFDQLDNDSFVQLEERTKSLNNLSKQMALLNYSFMNKADVNRQPNDLVDQRDLLLQKMSEISHIDVVEQANGMVDVYLGNKDNGNLLVDRLESNRLTVERVANNPEEAVIFIGMFDDKEVLQGSPGGELAGLQNFRNNNLKAVRDDLDEIANAFMDSVNAVQTTGIDADGLLGSAMFGIDGENVRAAGHMQVLLTASNQVATAAPLLIDQNSATSRLNLVSWELPEANVISVNETSMLSDSLTFIDGVNDSFSPNATNPAFVIPGNSVTDLRLEIPLADIDNVQIFTREGNHLFGNAALTALPSSTSFNTNATYSNTFLNAATTNDSYRDAFEIDRTSSPAVLRINGQLSDDLLVFVTGDASGSGVEFKSDWYAYTDQSAREQMTSAVKIDFTSNTEYTLTDVASGDVIATRTYAVGDTISINGWVAELKNTPVAGDSFTIRRNDSPTGDNRNMLAMAALQADREVFDGRGNFSEIYADVINGLGSLVVQASISRDAQQVLSDEAKANRDDISAVSLDEEAANLLRFQQAYQANAQVIQTANKLFESLLSLR